MPTEEKAATSQPKRPVFWGPRQLVTALVVVHLGLTCAAAYLSWRFERLSFDNDPPNSIARFLDAGLYGFQIGQIVLLISWGAFAGQSWFHRLTRFLVLAVWMRLLGTLGEGIIAGGLPAPSIAEEQTAYTLFLMLAPVVVLFSYGICIRKRFTPSGGAASKNSWQFSTRTLMLITAELALLLALEKIVLNNRFSFAEFWTALQVFSYQIQELIPVLVSVTILPVVFVGLARRCPWYVYAILGLHLLVCSLVLACLQLSDLSNTYGLNNPISWWPHPDLGRMIVERMILECVLSHLSAAATILLTFKVLRCIGYDFRRREEVPLKDGRNSSNARNSAASASA